MTPDQTTEILVELARFHERLSGMEKRLDEKIAGVKHELGVRGDRLEGDVKQVRGEVHEVKLSMSSSTGTGVFSEIQKLKQTDQQQGEQIADLQDTRETVQKALLRSAWALVVNLAILVGGLAVWAVKAGIAYATGGNTPQPP